MKVGKPSYSRSTIFSYVRFGEAHEDQSEYEATEQQTNMAAWLVAASPTSSLSVLEAERKGVTLL